MIQSTHHVELAAQMEPAVLILKRFVVVVPAPSTGSVEAAFLRLHAHRQVDSTGGAFNRV